MQGGLDYILHFASPASPIDYLKIPIQTLKVGSLGTHNLPNVNPQPEEYWGNVNPVGPGGGYDEAKRFSLRGHVIWAGIDFK